MNIPLHPELSQQGTEATLQEHQTALRALLREFDRVCKKLDIPYFLFAGTLLGAVRHQDFIPWDDDLDVLMCREDYNRLLREAPAVLDSERFTLQGEGDAHWPMFFSKLRLNGTTCLEPYYPKDPESHQGVYMDIFPCDKAYSGEFARKLQFLCSKVVIAKGLDARGYVTSSKGKKLFMALCRALPRELFHRIVRGPRGGSAYVHSFLGGASKYSRSVYPASCFAGARPLPFGDGWYPAPAGAEELLGILYGDYMRIPSEEERSSKKHALLVDLNKDYHCYSDYRDGMTFETVTRSIR